MTSASTSSWPAPRTSRPSCATPSVDSHGSVLTVTDIDEIGAIAQRLQGRTVIRLVGDHPPARELRDRSVQPSGRARDRLPIPHPDNIQEWFDQPGPGQSSVASQRVLIVQALDAARSLIDNATRQAQNIPPAVKGKADDAIARLQALETILGDPAVGPIQPGPDSLHGQVTTIARGGFRERDGTPRSCAGRPGLNAKLLSTIGLAKGRRQQCEPAAERGPRDGQD